MAEAITIIKHGYAMDSGKSIVLLTKTFLGNGAHSKTRFHNSDSIVAFVLTKLKSLGREYVCYRRDTVMIEAF